MPRSTLLLFTCVSALIICCLTKATAQCLQPELAVVNSCISLDNPTGQPARVEVEIIVLRNGVVPSPVDQTGIDLPFNGFGSRNADIGTSLDGTPFACNFKQPSVTSLTGCPNVILLGPGDTVPPLARVIFLSTGTAITSDLNPIDFTEICEESQPIYLLQNSCERSVSALSNSPGSGSNQLRAIGVATNCGFTTLVYDLTLIDQLDGSYYDAVNDAYGTREDCSVPSPNPALCSAEPSSFTFCEPQSERTINPQTIAELYSSTPTNVQLYASALDAALEHSPVPQITTTRQPYDTVFFRLNDAAGCSTASYLIIRQPVSNSDQLSCNPILESPVNSVRFETDGNEGVYSLHYGPVTDPEAFEDPLLGELIVDNLTAGDYQARLVTSDGCQIGNCNFSLQDTLCIGDTTELQLTLPSNQEYVFDQTGDVFTPERPSGTIEIAQTDGCPSYVNIQIDFIEVLTDREVYLPNAFSPNGDGANDDYGPSFRGGATFTLAVYDHWGGLMYEGNQAWDGTVNGKRAPVGVYLAIVEIATANNIIGPLVSSVTLLR